jgi:hypothetical protein
MKANAKMHSWVRLENVPRRRRKFQSQEYDPEPRVCYFKPSNYHSIRNLFKKVF